jgi:hypothetical protein
VRLITLEQAPWVIHHWTPFNDLQSGEASSPGYRRAVERQHATPDLSYGLEVWRGVKVFRVLWADDGRLESDSNRSSNAPALNSLRYSSLRHLKPGPGAATSA